MKNNYLFKKLAFIIMLLLLSCRTDLQNDSPQPSSSYVHQVTKQIVSLKEVSVFNNFLQKSKTYKSISNVYYKLSKESEVMIIKSDKRVSYSTVIEGENKNFTVLVFSVTNENKEFSFVAKYFPDSGFSNYEINNFTGIVSYESVDGNSMGKIKMINGIPTKINKSNSNASIAARIDCYYEPTVVAVTCTAGGDHYPGEACRGTQDQLAYYDVAFKLECSQDFESFAPESGGDYGGAGTSRMLSMSSQDALNYMLAQIGMNNLTLQQYNFLISNNTIANNFKNYFYNNQNVDGANFLYWGINFFMQNPTISWQQFENWFVAGYSENFKKRISQLSSSEIQGYITINKEIDISSYQEEYIKETNEAFVAFLANSDLDNMMVNNLASVIQNYCCSSFIFLPQAYAQEEAKLIVANYQFNRKFYPEWSKEKCFWEASKETIQFALDLGGLLPVVGEICDLTNAAIYYSTGDNLNATLSATSSIPIYGWLSATTKMGVKVVNKTATNIASRQVLKWVIGNDGLVKFGYSNQLRKVLMLTDATKQAHHIIPWAYNIQTHPIVQKAAKSMNTFHLNEELNGTAVASWRNQPNHNLYNERILTKLNSLPSNLTADQSYNALITIINQAKQAIVNNPTKHLNDIIF